MPAVRGGWRKGAARGDYLPLTDEVIVAHLSGDVEIGLYPLLDGDRCCWLAADFDGRTAMLDALAYLKAARAAGVSAGLEVSRSGTARTCGSSSLRRCPPLPPGRSASDCSVRRCRSGGT